MTSLYNNLMKFKNAQIIHIYVNPRSCIKMSRHDLQSKLQLAQFIVIGLYQIGRLLLICVFCEA